MIELDKTKVREAILIVSRALNDDDFLSWIQENEEELKEKYGDYRMTCYETDEEPEDFYNWALWQYVNSDDQ